MNSKPGDWNCRSCQHLNFSWRDSCQRCNEPRPSDCVGFTGRGGSEVRPGDWYCPASNCGAHNFASRSSCFKCGSFKDESSSSFDGDAQRSRGGFPFGGRSGWKSGDWICTRYIIFISRWSSILFRSIRRAVHSSSFSGTMDSFFPPFLLIAKAERVEMEKTVHCTAVDSFLHKLARKHVEKTMIQFSLVVFSTSSFFTSKWTLRFVEYRVST